jgi:hypothetical protein
MTPAANPRGTTPYTMRAGGDTLLVRPICHITLSPLQVTTASPSNIDGGACSPTPLVSTKTGRSEADVGSMRTAFMVPHAAHETAVA